MKTEKTTVLFTQKNSNYENLECDCWDEERNALNFLENAIEEEIIAHPPCRAWGRLRGLAKPSPGEKQLALFAISHIRQFGGVLEHPVGSKLWDIEYMKKNFPGFECLPMPGSSDSFGGFTIMIYQSWFSFPAEKKTFLYVCGCEIGEIPSYPLNFSAIEYTVESSKKINGKKAIPKSMRSTTSIELCSYLISIVTIIKNKKKLFKKRA